MGFVAIIATLAGFLVGFITAGFISFMLNR